MTSPHLILITYNDRGVEKELRIKREIAPKWSNLASVLGIPDSEILSIKKSNHQDEEECVDSMLKKWMQRDEDCTWRKLILNMRKVQLGSAAADLAKALRNKVNSTYT